VLVGVRERGETDAGPGALAAVDRIARVRQCLGGVLRRGDRLLAGTRGEMAVLLPDSGSRAASEAFVQRIRDYLSDALAPPFGPTRSSASPAIEVCIDALSTARFPEDADSAATLLSIARRDLALQRAAGEGDPVQAFPGRITRSVALEETHSSDANST
jgi:hypothetical protein